MPEHHLLNTEGRTTRTQIADALREPADQIESRDVQLVGDTDEQTVAVPDRPRFEVDLERLTESEPGGQRYELEYVIG
jgi:amphi-Trp domain-containing protein